MLLESETWYLRKYEMMILKRTEKEMIQAIIMCKVNFIGKKQNSQELINVLSSEETVKRLTKTNRTQWCRCVFRKESYVFRRALQL